MKTTSKLKRLLAAIAFGIYSLLFLGLIYLLPINHLFIDAFGEAIKYHDVTDISLSKFRDLDAPDLFDSRIVIINTQRTDRRQVATAVDYLHRHRAGAIGVDLLFDTYGEPSADSTLAVALAHPEVVLAYAFPEVMSGKSYYASSSLGGEEGVKSVDMFSDRAAQGYVNLGSDDGFTVRAFEPMHDGQQSFGLELASLVDASIISDVKARNHSIEWINFRRPQPGKRNMIYPINPKGAINYAFVQIDDFLQDTASFAANFWEGKIVLLGFVGEDEESLSMNDRYYTPLNQRYYHRSLPDMHGVCIHANIISMLLDRDWIDELPKWGVYLLCLLIFAFNYLIFDYLHHRKKVTVVAVRVIQLIQFLILIGICIFLMASQSFKVAFILPIVSVIISFEFFELYHYVKRRLPFSKRKKQHS